MSPSVAAVDSAGGDVVQADVTGVGRGRVCGLRNPSREFYGPKRESPLSPLYQVGKVEVVLTVRACRGRLLVRPPGRQEQPLHTLPAWAAPFHSVRASPLSGNAVKIFS
mgnify:CR=1 FL=1